MKQNIARLVILGVLIGLCLGQTIRLWLGDVSGHNFFAPEVINDEMNYTEPKQIWCNVSSKIYKIISSSEKEDLIQELMSGLRQSRLKMEKSSKEEYTKLLYSTQGILYEYGKPLSVGEIIGQTISVEGEKFSDKDIKEIYIDLSLANASKTYIYLIDEKNQIKNKFSINSSLRSGMEVVKLYTENEQGHKAYQASMTDNNMAGWFEGNVFYPIIDEKNPVTVKPFQFVPIIEEGDSVSLENYVNELFKNPNYKTKSRLLNGDIAFSDNLSISVIYRKQGILEFERTLLNDGDKLTSVERLNKINYFINSSGAIPEKLKKGLYLEESLYSEKTGAYCYRFGFRHENGEVVYLGSGAKSQLGITAFLELKIKNSEITSGKWLMQIPENIEEEQEITMSSLEAYEAIYKKAGVNEENEFLLKDLECAYVVSNMNQMADFNWVGIYKGQPILAIEKNDSGE